MEYSLIIWLVICGIVTVMGFGVGINYLSEWKEGVIESARNEVEFDVEGKLKYNADLAKYRAQAKISLPIWITCFGLAFIFLGIIGYTLMH